MTPNCMHCNRPLEAHAPRPDGDSTCPDGKNTFNFEFQINPEVLAFVQDNLDKPSDELARLWIDRVRAKHGVSPLVRVLTPEHDHPHEGLIICRDHLRQVMTAEDLPFSMETIPADQIAFWNYRCLMCGVDEIAGRLCENPECRRPLHPQWPAVYCRNACALDDL